MSKSKKNQARKRVVLVVIIFLAVSAINFSPSFAGNGGDSKVLVTVQAPDKTNKNQKKNARKIYLEALKKADAGYRTERKIALSEYKRALKSAENKALRTKAKRQYQDALYESQEKMQTAKKDALNIYKSS